MAAKRKAGDGVAGTSKRVASGMATPASHASSDDEYFDDDHNLSSDPEYAQANRLASRFGGKSQKTAAAAKKAQVSVSGGEKHFGNGLRDFSHLELKPDHMQRPMFIDPVNYNIIVESFAPTFKQAEDFLINVAEPQSRVSRIHEYSLTSNSLYAAVSVGLTTQDIIARLNYFSKTPLPEQLVEFIHQSTKAYGQARLVLKHNKFFVESSDPSILQTLLRDPEIRGYRADETADFTTEAAPQMGSLYIPGTKLAAGAKQADNAQSRPQDDENKEIAEQDAMMAQLLEEDDDDEQPDQVHAFEVKPASIQALRKRCEVIDYPLTVEYDFRNDTMNPNLEIDLKPAAQIRPYQEQALSKMFGNGRARSGIIVLPCGAGKTLVGITAACTVKKGIIVLCTSTMSVTQWRNEFLNWTNINPEDIACFTRHEKQRFPRDTGVLITNYTMISMGRGEDDDGEDSGTGKKKNGQGTDKRRMAHDTKRVIDFIRNREWGLMILDEVHVVPAEMFSKVTYRVKAHTKLGLTATLLREDDKITELNFLIGPKLFEANWQELSEQGHIARVQCAEVWCPMTHEFYEEYLKAKTPQQRLLLSTMNPRKFQACQFLIDYHEKRGDKIIVFSDNVYALKAYCDKMGKLRIDGKTSDAERLTTLENFKYASDSWAAALFLSKIGDTSLDIPEATCLIQISSHYGSRRQEAQRLGRILRAKRRNDEGFNAFFYSLVSKDTQEVYYATKRQRFLVDQGYAFKVITHLSGIDRLPGLAFATRNEQIELLKAVAVDAATASADTEQIEDDIWGDSSKFARRAGGTSKKYKRSGGMLADLGGGNHMVYVEQNKSKKPVASKNSSIQKIMRAEKKRQEGWKNMK
jgi:DNA excision repair protein ERCC-3